MSSSYVVSHLRRGQGERVSKQKSDENPRSCGRERRTENKRDKNQNKKKARRSRQENNEKKYSLTACFVSNRSTDEKTAAVLLVKFAYCCSVHTRPHLVPISVEVVLHDALDALCVNRRLLARRQVVVIVIITPRLPSRHGEKRRFFC